MAITKTQINYLEQKLRRIGDEKITKFKGEHVQYTKSQIALKEIKAGRVKLLSKTEMLKMLCDNIALENKEGTYTYSYYNNPTFSITDFISDKDREKVEELYDKSCNEVNVYVTNIKTAIQNALDKIVLEDVDVEIAMQELNKF